MSRVSTPSRPPVDPPASITDGLPPIETWIPQLDDDLGRSWTAGDHRVVDAGPLSATPGWSVDDAPAGARADRPDLHPRPDALVHHLGVCLRRFHDAPLDAAPDRPALELVRTRLRDRLAAGAIEASSLPEPYRRHPAERLVELVDVGLDERLADRPMVPVHGGPVLGRFLVTPAGATTLVDGPIGVGDAHLDLAICHRQVHEVMGPGAVFEFYDGYGIDADLVLLDRFTLAALLR